MIRLPTQMEINREVDAIQKETTAKETNGCGVVQGTVRKEGDTWQKDVCTQCSCKVSDLFSRCVVFNRRSVECNSRAVIYNHQGVLCS